MTSLTKRSYMFATAVLGLAAVLTPSSRDANAGVFTSDFAGGLDVSQWVLTGGSDVSVSGGVVDVRAARDWSPASRLTHTMSTGSGDFLAQFDIQCDGAGNGIFNVGWVDADDYSYVQKHSDFSTITSWWTNHSAAYLSFGYSGAMSLNASINGTSINGGGQFHDMGTSNWRTVIMQRTGAILTAKAFDRGTDVQRGTVSMTLPSNSNYGHFIVGTWDNLCNNWVSHYQIDNVRLITGQVTPPQPVRPDPVPVTPTGKKDLVLYTHGWNTSQADWDNPTGVWQSLGSALSSAVNSDWAVQGYSWAEDSGNMLTGPGYALNEATERGRIVGKSIAAAGYEHVHLIAHSAGSALVTTAAEYIKALSPATEVQVTFLDPYIGLGSGFNLYGAAADWADNYFATDDTGALTERSLANAHNVNVSLLDPNHTISFTGRVNSTHGWPIQFYTNTIQNPSFAPNYGFARSLEGGGWVNRTAYPEGNAPVVLGTGESPTAGGSVRMDPATNLANTMHVTSTTGFISITGTGVSLLTGSPVWMSSVLTAPDRVNVLTFEAEFTSALGAEGLLSVFWDDQLVGSIDERYVLAGIHEYTFFLPETYEAGDYLLAFRLDPYTSTPSSVNIDSVQSGLVVPEPTTLFVLLSGALVVLRRQKSDIEA